MHPGHTFLKGLNLPLVLLGLASILTIASDLSLGDNTTSTIFRIIGLLMIVPPMLDYILTRFSMAKRGFGNVYSEASGLLDHKNRVD